MQGEHKLSALSRRLIVIAGFGVCAQAAVHVHAQDAESVIVDVGECVVLETVDERTACFEATIEAANQAREEALQNPAEDAAAAVPAPREPADAAAPAAARPAPAARREPFIEPEQELDEFVATVTATREFEPNALIITLDNGQIWRQNRPRRYLLLDGTEVVMRESNWGSSYRLTNPDVGGFIVVERIR